MQPRIRMGLTVGAIGMALNICVSAVMGFCGPFLSLLAGGAAGYFAAQQEKLPTKGDGATAGAIAGGLAGVLIILGQMLGGIAVLLIAQTTGIEPLLGEIPDLNSDPASLVGYYFGGLFTSLCFGIIGAALAAGAGGAAGYMATQNPSSTGFTS